METNAVAEETPASPRIAPVWWRLLLAIWIGGVCGGVSWIFRSIPQPLASDFAIIHAAARGWLAGLDPYSIVGPGRPFEWQYFLIYPFPAVLVGVPLASLPIQWAEAVFLAFGMGLLAWVVAAQPPLKPMWWAVPSAATVGVVASAQWSALLTAAALLPALGFLLVCKPSIGAALWIGYPSRRSLVGILVFILLSVALLPSWPVTWLTLIFSGTSHMRAPVQYWGGPLLLLAWLKWRVPEARLLGALSLVPQTDVIYEALPLFLIPRSHGSAAALWGLSWTVLLVQPLTGWDPPTGQLMVYLLYLPCLLFVLQRREKGAIRPVRADAVEDPVTPTWGGETVGGPSAGPSCKNHAES